MPRRTSSRQPHHVASEIARSLDYLSDQLSHDSVTADSFAIRTACQRYLRKYKGHADKAALEREAFTTFQRVEESVRQTNNRIRQLALSGPALFCLDEARRIVDSILGRFDYVEWFSCCEWGPGATASIKAQNATPDQKMLERRLTVSRKAMKYASWYLSYDKNWFAARTGIFPEGEFSALRSNFQLWEPERGTTVEKDIRSRRWISVQATFNLFLQKGVGKMIRTRLKRRGIDLDDQSRNQWLASISQRYGLATIDLSNASDSLSYELVRHLVPEEWFVILSDLRHSSVTWEGSEYRLEKFSAMGNGFTFELESLIFYALSESLKRRFDVPGPLGIYGDDIVLPSVLSSALAALFKEVGFSVNAEKSFSEGRYYESCGKHYYDGIDVTPPLQKEVISDLPSACRAANRLYRFALRLGGGQVPDERIYRSWSIAASAAIAFHKALNADRSARAEKTGRRVKPLPFPFLPPWLERDDGLLCPSAAFTTSRGFIRFYVYSPLARSKPGEEQALLALYLRRGKQQSKATYGVVNPRGVGGYGLHQSKTEVDPYYVWPDFWPLPSN